MPKTAVGSIGIKDSSDLHYGGSVAFDTEVSGLRGTQYPMVYVECWQDGDKVYGRLDRPDTEFVFSGGSNKWIANGGGAATCQASVRAYGGKGGISYATILDTIEFEVEA